MKWNALLFAIKSIPMGAKVHLKTFIDKDNLSSLLKMTISPLSQQFSESKIAFEL